MCGIVGIVGSRDPIEATTVLAMRDALAHRGPDGSGLGFSHDGRSAFGHRRLAILEPTAAGLQPMHNRARTLMAVSDGTISNFRELAADLAGAGYIFATRSDTEVLLAAFEHWGLDAVERLRGGFALAVQNEETQECVLVRDRLGVKPLYYTVSEGVLHFASESTALFQVPTITRDLDLAALGDYLAYGYVPGDRSIWRGVHKLEPGHLLVFASGEARIRRYWSALAGMESAHSSAGTPDELRSVIKEAVRLAMIADVPVGAFLSDELDAAILVALMGVTGDPVQTFSIALNERARHDSGRSDPAYARLVAQRYTLEHHESRLPLDHSLATVAEVIETFDEPIADASMIADFLLAQDVAREMKLALSSVGGNVIFGGAPGSTLGPLGPRAARDLELLRQNAIYDVKSRRALLDPAIAAEMDDDLLRIFRPHWRSDLGESSRLRFLELQTAVADRVLVRIDRASMRHALEVRLPFLDHRVVEESLRLLRSSRGKEGDLRRTLARELIPEDAVMAGTAASSPPPWRWIHGAPARFGSWLEQRTGSRIADGDIVVELSTSDEARARLLSGDLVRRGIVRREAVENVLSRPSPANRRRAWLLLVLDLWVEAHVP